MSDSQRPNPNSNPDSKLPSDNQPDDEFVLPFDPSDSSEAAIPLDDEAVIELGSRDDIDIPDEWLASGDAVAVDSQAGDAQPPMASDDEIYVFSSQAGMDSEAGEEMLSDSGTDLISGSNAGMNSDAPIEIVDEVEDDDAPIALDDEDEDDDAPISLVDEDDVDDDDMAVALDSQDDIDIPDDWLASGDAVAVEPESADSHSESASGHSQSPMASDDAVYVYSSQAGMDSEAESAMGEEKRSESGTDFIADSSDGMDLDAPIAIVDEDDVDDDEKVVAIGSQGDIDIPDEWLASGDAVAVDSQAGDSQSPMASDDAIYVYSSQAGMEPEAESASGAEMLSDSGTDLIDDFSDGMESDAPIAIVDEDDADDDDNVVDSEAESALGEEMLSDSGTELVADSSAGMESDAPISLENEDEVEDDNAPIAVVDENDEDEADDALVMESQDVVDIPAEWLESGDAVAVEPQSGQSSSHMRSSDAVYTYSSRAGTDSEAESGSDAEMQSDSGTDKADRGLNVLFGTSADLGTKSDSDVLLYNGNIVNAGDSAAASDSGSVSDSGVVVSDSNAYDKTMQSDDFEEMAGASSVSDSATLSDSGSVSDSAMLSDSGYVSGSGSGSGAGPSADFDKTMQSDDFEMMGSGSGVSSSADSEILSDSGSGAIADYDKTMQSDDYEAANQEEFGKTIQIDEFEGNAPRGWLGGGDDEYGKTMMAEEFAMPGADASGDMFGKTMQSDGGSSGAGWDAAQTMMDDKGGNADDGSRTVVLDDDGIQKPLAEATIAQNLPPRVPTQDGATRWEGGRTSGMATSAPGMGIGSGREALAVAARSVSGMSYGDETFGDYRLVKQLGEGGMGVVYVAKQSSLARDVVFKTLKPMAPDQQEKLKSEGRYKSIIDHRTKMFLSEAVVTADLFHPNIVPIYELGEAPDGSLFYAMKWVRGEPWHKQFKDMTLEDNLDVLMKVSDAIAFAHARQIVNRDLKPENVMLGEFGEVIVLDWGLALPFGDAEKRLPVALTAGLGSGTPAYMPPELITGPLSSIGPSADIYLLGAMLFELVTGVPPHEFNMPAQSSARQKMAEVRRIVSENIIRPADELLTRYEVKHRVVMDNEIRTTEHRGELIDICMKAMATKPQDRYHNVQQFQQALREYEKHAASRMLSARATEMTSESAPVAQAAGLHGYTRYQNSLALYQESLREWSGNADARDGLTQTQHDFAELALTNGDYDLGLSVLDTNAESHAEPRTKLLAAKKDREGHAKRMKMLKAAAIALLCMFGVVSAVAARFQFNLKAAVQLANKAAEDAKVADQKATEADQKAKEAEGKAEVAEVKTKEAEVAFVKANEAKTEAEQKQAEAEENKKVAEKNLVKAKDDLMLAGTKLKEADEQLVAADEKLVKANEKTTDAMKQQKVAEEKVKEADTKLVVANKSLETAEEKLVAASERVSDASYHAGLADADRHVREGRYPDARKKLAELKKSYAERCKVEWQLLWDTVEEGQAVSLSRPIEALGLSRDGRVLAAVENDGTIVVWSVDEAGLIDEEKSRRLNHGARPRTVVVSPSGRLIAVAGDTGAIQIWAVEESRAITELSGHVNGVNALQFSADETRLVSGGDDRSLRVWDLATGRELASVKCLYAVQCLDWSPNGQTLVAGTGTSDEVHGMAYAWEVASNAESVALKEIRRFQAPPSGTVKQNRSVVSIALSSDGQYVACNGPASELFLFRVRKSTGDVLKTLKVTDSAVRVGQHSKRVERVRSLAFSTDGSRLIAGGDDGTISIWDRAKSDGAAAALPRFDRGLILYGHSGPVRSCRIMPQSPDRVISASYDQHVWVWNLKTYPNSRKWLDQTTAADDQKAAIIRPELDWLFASTESFEVEQQRSVIKPQQSPAFFFDSAGLGERGGVSSPVVFSTANQGADCAPFAKNSRDVAWLDQQKPAGAKSPVRIVTGHTDSVLSASFRRDGLRVLTSSRDQTARVWDTQSGKPIRAEDGAVLFADNLLKEGHEYDVFSTLIFPNAERLLTSSFDGTMRIWDARVEPQNSAGRELATLPQTGMFGVVNISRDGEWIVTAGRGNAAQLWKLSDVLTQRHPQPARVFDGQHRFRVTAVTISPDNRVVLTADREGNVIVWSAESGDVIGRKRAAHGGEVTKVVFLKDGSQLLTAGVDRRAVLWNVVRADAEVSLQSVKRFEHDGMIVNLSLSPNEDRFLSVARKGDKAAAARAKAAAADKLKVKAVGTKSQPTASLTTLTLWTLADGAARVIELPPIAASETAELTNRGNVSSSWNVDGKQAIVTTADGLLHLFDADAGRFTQTLEINELGSGGNRLRAVSAMFTPQESPPRHVVTQSQNGVTLWRLADGSKLTTFRPQGILFSASYSSDGKVVATGGQSLRLFDADEASPRFGRSLHKIESPHGGIVTSVEFSPVENSQRFVTTSWDGTAKVWEWQPADQNARQLHLLAGHDGPVRFGTWSPDGRRILTVGHDARPRVWTFADDAAAPTSVELPMAEDRDFDQLCGAFSWDGQFVAVGGRDVSTQESLGWIWKLATDADQPAVLHATVRGHGLGGINAVAFHPLDDRLLTAGTDGTARLWDWQKNRKPGDEGVLDAVYLLSLTRPGEATTHRGPVTSLRITPDGKIATASADGTALIWLISRPAALPKVEG